MVRGTKGHPDLQITRPSSGWRAYQPGEGLHWDGDNSSRILAMLSDRGRSFFVFFGREGNVLFCRMDSIGT